MNKLTDKILLLEIRYLLSIHYKGQRRDDTSQLQSTEPIVDGKRKQLTTYKPNNFRICLQANLIKKKTVTPTLPSSSNGQHT